MKYKVLIFDFFGVLCSEVSPFWFEENFSENSSEVKNYFMRSADSGNISQKDLFIQLSKISNLPADIIEKDWIKKAHIDLELIDFIKTLKKTYKLAILSNSISPYFHTITKGLGLNEIFDEVVLSSEIKHAKPEPEAFWKILNRMNVKPEDCLFIDDNPINTKAGEELGIDCYLFTNTQDLKTLLQTKNETSR